ncbi:MAG: hypothetical protein VKI81_06855 [Synechococcaceae cyanobacterium]|nr:hypothetical protein [Synechococcaceae cyanobacterium]
MTSGFPLGRVPLTVPGPPPGATPGPVSGPAGGSAPAASRIQLDSSLRRWFTRNLGLWRSRRLYFFADGDVLRVDMLLRVESFEEPMEGEAAYRFTWWPEQEHEFFERKPRYVREGTMEAYLCGHQLRRSRGYFCGSPTRSRIRQVDEHEMIFESHYQEWDILEQIRLVDQDRYRSRFIHSWRDGVLDLAETHHEIRLEAPDGSGTLA